MNSWTERAATAANTIGERTQIKPTVGIVLGTGLGTVTNEIESPVVVETSALENYPPSTVDGHAGAIVVGSLAGRQVAVLSGRVHLYEGYGAFELGFGVRVLHQLGCQTLIVTNAAGALNPDFRPGDVMVITDHISLPSLAA